MEAARGAAAVAEHGALPAYIASAAEVRAFLAAGLAVDPPFSGLAEERFALDAQEAVAAASGDLAEEHWHGATLVAALGFAAVPEAFARSAVGDVLGATAAGVAYAAAGRIDVGPEAVDAALERVQGFIASAGFGALVRVQAAATTFEDLQAIAFYDPMEEQVFLSGLWHRPWAGRHLHDDLLLAAAAGAVRLRPGADGGRQLVLSARGHAALAAIRLRLEASGYLTERHRRLVAAHARPEPAPSPWESDLPEVWEELLAAVGVGPGVRVLICGVAPGGAGLLAEVARRVGAEGEVLLVEPAGAWTRAAVPAGVRVLHARLDALPLADGAVDACLAPHFLHLGEHDRALAEVRRVVRRGGRVALGAPRSVDLDHAALQPWLEPLRALAARLDVPVSGRQGPEGRAGAGEALERHGFHGLEVRTGMLPLGAPSHDALLHALHDAEVLREVFARIPWRERHALVQQMRTRGEAVAEALRCGVHALAVSGEIAVASVP